MTGSQLLTSVSPKADTALTHLAQAIPGGTKNPFGLSFDLLISQAIDTARRSPAEIARPAWSERAPAPEPRRPTETRNHDDGRDAAFAVAVVEPPRRDPVPPARRGDTGNEATTPPMPEERAAPSDPGQPHAISAPATKAAAPADAATAQGRLPDMAGMSWLADGGAFAGAKAAPDAAISLRPLGPVGQGAATPAAPTTATGIAAVDPSLAAALREVHLTAVKQADHLVSQPAAARVPWTLAVDPSQATGNPAIGLANGQASSTQSAARAGAHAATPSATLMPSASAATGAATGAAGGEAVAATQAAAAVPFAPASVAAMTPAGEPQALRPLGEGPGGPATPATISGPGAAGATVRPTGSGPVPTDRPAVLPMEVRDQVSVRIARAVSAGQDQIEIRLKPAELGRLEIRLELAGDGRVQATITADTRQTLDLLRADARGLERALQDAGLRTDSGGLSFNLRGDGDAPARNHTPTTSAGETGARAGTDATTDDETTPPGNASAAANGRIDIRA